MWAGNPKIHLAAATGYRTRGWVSKDIIPPPGQHGHMLEKEVPGEMEEPGSSCHSGAVREDED